MRFQIEHRTRLNFSAPVYEHHIELRFTPRPGPYHRVLSTSITLQPDAHLFHYTDAFGNAVQHFDVVSPHETLTTTSLAEVETTLTNPFDFELLSPPQEEVWYRNRLKEDPFLFQFILHRSPAVPEWTSLSLSTFTPPVFDTQSSVQVSVLRAVDWVAETLHYVPGSSHIHSSLADILRTREGVCQDYAHFLIALLRSWKIPARYVMGYLNIQPNTSGISQEQATHAWVEALIPGAGWRGFDATHRLCVNDQYIPLAVGRDYLDAAPQRGTFKGSFVEQQQEIHVILQQTQQAAQ